jgi:hypothetical protein
MDRGTVSEDEVEDGDPSMWCVELACDTVESMRKWSGATGIVSLLMTGIELDIGWEPSTMEGGIISVSLTW